MTEAATLIAAVQAEARPVRSAKKDTSSVANILQHVQDNVARGKASGVRRSEAMSLSQVFSIGSEQAAAGPGFGGSGGSVGSGSYEELLHRLSNWKAVEEGPRALEKEVLAVLPKMEPSRVPEVVCRAQEADGLRNGRFLDEICEVLARPPSVIARLTSAQLTRCLVTLVAWALLVSSVDEACAPELSGALKGCFAAIAREMSLQLMEATPLDLSQTASSFASVGLRDTALFSSLARVVAARWERFSSKELLATLEAFELVRFVHTGLFEVLARFLRGHVRQLPVSELNRGVRILSSCCLRDDELGHLIGVELPKKAREDEATEDFCGLAWHFCALGFCHEELFRSAFSALRDMLVGSDTLCRLFEIHTVLRLFHADTYEHFRLEDDTVQSLREHYKKHRGKRGSQKLSRSAEKLHDEVASVLRDVLDGWSVQRQHQTPCGLLVDLAAMRRKGSAPGLCVEIEGPQSLVSCLDAAADRTPAEREKPRDCDRLRGPVLMRRRVLQQSGLALAVIPEDLWRSLEDHAQKRNLLRELVKLSGCAA